MSAAPSRSLPARNGTARRASIISAPGISPGRRGGLRARTRSWPVPKSANPQSWNRYAYGFNNPLRFTDPTGMYTCEGPRIIASSLRRPGWQFLGSDDAAAKRAANAYGGAKDNNGIVVRFADKLQNDRGGTVVRDAPGGVRVDPSEPSKLQASLLPDRKAGAPMFSDALAPIGRAGVGHTTTMPRTAELGKRGLSDA